MILVIFYLLSLNVYLVFAEGFTCLNKVTIAYQPKKGMQGIEWDTEHKTFNLTEF